MSQPLSPLIQYTLRGLKHCYMPNVGLWSHKYHFDWTGDRNESLRHSDLFYSLNVLLGMGRIGVENVAGDYDCRALYDAAANNLLTAPVRHYAYGMALWAADVLGCDVPTPVLAKVRELTADSSAMQSWMAQDVGLMLTGVCSLAKHDSSWRPVAQRLRDLILTHFLGPRDLFYDSGVGLRRHFASFATQVYSTLGLYYYGDLTADPKAYAAADACIRKLISVQGSLGEWPWFYNVAGGHVIDFYEVYSVHQHGMAPAILHHAVARGVPGAREALHKGFLWIFGANEMAKTMLRPEVHLIHRSQKRAGFRGSREARVIRSVVNKALGRHDKIEGNGGAGLEFTQEVRSYELGWILWSFGGRDDYADLTSHQDFVRALT